MNAVRRCRSCQAGILWATTAAGRPIPLNLEPVGPDGTRRGLFVWTSETHVRAATATDPGPFFQAHHATCPHAAQHRKGRR